MTSKSLRVVTSKTLLPLRGTGGLNGADIRCLYTGKRRGIIFKDPDIRRNVLLLSTSPAIATRCSGTVRGQERAV